jgi:hypothetical protein
LLCCVSDFASLFLQAIATSPEADGAEEDDQQQEHCCCHHHLHHTEPFCCNRYSLVMDAARCFSPAKLLVVFWASKAHVSTGIKKQSMELLPAWAALQPYRLRSSCCASYVQWGS